MPAPTACSMYGVSDIAAHHSLQYLWGYLSTWASTGDPMLPEDMDYALGQVQRIIDHEHDQRRESL